MTILRGFRDKTRKLTLGLTFQILGRVIVLLMTFGVIIAVVGYKRFTESLVREYDDSAVRTAQTAVYMFNELGVEEHIDEFIATEGDSDFYRSCRKQLDALCQKQGVTLLYLIRVDQSDYGHFTCVFNTVNEDSEYDAWSCGYVRDTTNEEYRTLYRQIYEEGLEKASLVRNAGLRGYNPHITTLVPLKDKMGYVRGIMCVQRPMENLSRGRTVYLQWVATITVVLGVIVCQAAYFFMHRQFVQPVKKITKEAERFARENRLDENVNLEQVSVVLEIDKLASSVMQMESDTVQYMDSLTAVTAEKERIGAELNMAKSIQTSQLPNTFPAFPENREFDIYATMVTAKQVGGDFYDFFLLDDDHLAMTIADVSGKGVPAALFMMVSRTLIKSHVLDGYSPGRSLDLINERLMEGNDEEMFVTVWLAVLDLRTGEGVAANGGHEHPAIRRAGGKYELVIYKHSPMLGIIEGVKYTEHSFKMEPGDTLFVYTDGVPEATDSNKELFGEERMIEALNRDPGAEPKMVLQNVMDGINEFVGDAEQFDDITMMAVRYNGRQEKT